MVKPKTIHTMNSIRFLKYGLQVMTPEEREVITDLSKCDFTEITEHFRRKREAQKQLSSEERQKKKEELAAVTEHYGYCLIDGDKVKIANFRVDPPGLFRGRGTHPKQGMVRRRIQPEDVIINCGK